MAGLTNDKKMVKETEQDIRLPGEDSAANTSFTGDSKFQLIRFDKKVKIYVAGCLFFYLFFVAFKWHNSSIPLWNANMSDGGNEKRGLLAGKPLDIRSDEWLVVSSFILSQEKNHFPISNEALGYGKTPLLMGLPTTHILSILKPPLWGYYFLDNERAFSWQWNFKTFPFLISSFLFLMLFTRNNFIISLFGSVWLFLSSAIQWWSINTEIFTFGFSSIISLVYILYSNKTRLIILNGLIFLLASYSFAVILYPAYQVPLAYFIFALVLGYLISTKSLKLLLNRKFIKLSVLVGSTIFLIVLLYLFYKDCKDTIQVVSNTVYPGKRNETGGDFRFLSMFRDNFSWFLNEAAFPPKWGNICELSSYLMLSPVAAILIIYSFIKTKKINPLFIPLLFFQIVIYIWLFVGFPEFLSRLTLFNTSPTTRTFFVFGFSNVVFTILYLGQFKKTVDNPSTRNKKAVIFITIFSIAFGINYFLNKQADRFFSIVQVFNASIFFSILNWLVMYFKERKIFQYLFVATCFSFIASNIFINPLSKGLSPYFENKIYKTVSQIKEKDPVAGWVVFGHMTAPDFLKAAGINCFNGVQFAPPLEKLHILDPNFRNNDIYNRYAHIMFFPLINGKDSIRFSLNQPDLYTIQMDPCSPRLKQIGINYFLFSYKPSEAEVRCLSPVKDIFDFYIYKRKDL
jgi:hypothetical protein